MAFNMFAIPVSFIGTISADNYVDFDMPVDATLIGLSADGDTQDFNVIVGTTSDADAYVNTTDGAVTAGTVLDLNEKGDFVGDQFHHIAQGTATRVTLDHTGSNPVDVFIVLYFTPG